MKETKSTEDNNRITAPFNKAQVEALNFYQQSGAMHPFTCASIIHEEREELSPDLVATKNGWVCPRDGCSYTQDWAHPFMVDKQAIEKHLKSFKPL